MTKQIVDYFSYFNEKELLELRIKTLYNHVDKFVIVESDKTFSGEPKEFSCLKVLEELDLLSEKIEVKEISLPSDDEITKFTDLDFFSALQNNTSVTQERLKFWVRERLQREAIKEDLDRYDDNTVFIITDCDEIISPEYIDYFSNIALSDKNSIIKLPLVWLLGRADLRVYDVSGIQLKWDTLPFLCTKSHLESKYPVLQLRMAIDIDYSTVYVFQDGQRIEDVGWHFSWMGHPSTRVEKANSFKNIEIFNDELINSFKETSFVEGNLNYLDRQQMTLVKYDESNLPSEIFELPRVKNFLIP